MNWLHATYTVGTIFLWLYNYAVFGENEFIKPTLYYWAREAKNSSAEIDYLVELNSNVIPIEIKSGDE